MGDSSKGALGYILGLKKSDGKAIADILEEFNNKKQGNEKLHFLLEKLGDESISEVDKKELRAKIGDAIDASEQKLQITYDSFSEGLEPAYFWVHDFMKQIALKVSKTREEFEASVGSAFFSDVGQKATRMQEQAMKMMGSINTVIRSIINILYDLKEFDIRLKNYDDYKNKTGEEKRAALLTLKQIWMDQVDIKKGVGSINGLSQQLQFVTLRDAYLTADTIANIKELDLNDRVKRILQTKLQEFEGWLTTSDEELHKRYNIERAYLKSQVASLKVYADWTRPYLIAAKKLGMKEFDKSDIISMFNNMEIEIELRGDREMKIDDLIEKEELPLNAATTQKIFACTFVKFMFRSVPHSVSTQQGYQYRQGGRLDMYFYSFGLTEKEKKILEGAKEKEGFDLIDDMLNTSIGALQKELVDYLDEKDGLKKRKEAEKEAEKKKEPSLFKLFIGSPGDLIKPFKSMFKSGGAYFDAIVLKKAQDEANNNAFTVYDVYKKAHGMLSV